MRRCNLLSFSWFFSICASRGRSNSLRVGVYLNRFFCDSAEAAGCLGRREWLLPAASRVLFWYSSDAASITRRLELLLPAASLVVWYSADAASCLQRLELLQPAASRFV